MPEKTTEQLETAELRTLCEDREESILSVAGAIKGLHVNVRSIKDKESREALVRQLHRTLKRMKGNVDRAMTLLGKLHGVECEDELPLVGAANGVKE